MVVIGSRLDLKTLFPFMNAHKQWLVQRPRNTVGFVALEVAKKRLLQQECWMYRLLEVGDKD